MNLGQNFQKEECCGCRACYNICPTKAIQMSPDEKGFLYPVVDKDKCIDCGLCIKVCNFQKFIPTDLVPDCFAVKHVNENEIATSRSGAFFIALAQQVLNQNGIVFGCVIENSRFVFLKWADGKEGVNEFKGSKYVSSDTRDTFKECEDFLKTGRTVLFSGLGCQVHGLLSYLKLKNVNTANLITCDLVCHGAPSPKLWEQFVDRTEEIVNNKILSADFRDKKRFGWRAHLETFNLSDGQALSYRRWTDIFYAHVMFKESCYNCKYTTPNRKSDFTIADYWGIEKNVPEFDDDKGVSLVLVRTQKAKDVFASLNNIKAVKTDLRNSLQPQLLHPAKKGKEYNRFWKDYLADNQKAIKKYFFPSKARLLKKNIYAMLRRAKGKLGSMKRRLLSSK